MLKKVLLMVNYNLYDSKRHFTKKLAEAMVRKGITTKIIDVNEEAIEGEIGAIIKRFKPDMTCSFNTLSSLTNGKFLWDVLQIPHLSILVDPALYSIQLTNSPYSILSCVDHFDYSAIRSYRFNNVFFWPHGIEADIQESIGERPYDVVFMGSCYDYESLRHYWQERFSSEINKALDHAIDLVLSDKPISLAQALVSAWNSSGLSPQKADFTSLFYFLDNYTKGKDRVELIRSIKDAPVHVFGELVTDHPACKLGWKDYLGKQRNVTIHPSVSFSESLQILGKSKICLNSMPFFRNGSHERVLASFACGALPITSDSLYWREQFATDELVIYPPGNWSVINGTVNDLLANKTKRESMVKRGRTKVMQKHTWDERVDQLMQEIPPILNYMNAAIHAK